MIVTAREYGQFLLNSPVNFTGTYFADSVDELHHDSVYRFLRDSSITPDVVRRYSMQDVVESPNGYVIYDDTVVDKNHSRSIELVRRQYSGNAGRVIRGIGIVTAIYYNPDVDEFYVLDYRIWDKAGDGKTKLDLVAEMFDGFVNKRLVFRYVLMDTWYATTALMCRIAAAEKIYYCPMKTNRMVDDSGGTKPYQAVNTLEWSKDELQHGKLVKVRGFAMDTKHKLFRVTISTDRTDYVITNDVTQDSADDVRKAHAIRWKIEEFHRELKQLTGIEKCQSRKARSQRNHIAIAIRVWACLKREARALGITIYELKHGALRDYVATLWLQPVTKFR
jgi:hypothetical protein